MESWQSQVYCIGLENRRTEMFREFESHTFLQSQDAYVTASYRRMSHSRVSHSDGIHRVSWVTVQEIRMIFPPD